MIELSTLQAVREIVTIVGVISGLSYYFLTLQNANKAIAEHVVPNGAHLCRTTC
jgi:hypothetical protein